MSDLALRKQSLETQEAQEALKLYFEKNEIMDFAKIPSYAKLTLLQKTPKDFIRRLS